MTAARRDRHLTGAEAFMADELDDAHLLAEHRAACDEIKRLRSQLVAVIPYVQRLQSGWAPRRDGCGFLRWHRRGVWESMTEAEASLWHVVSTDEATP